MQFRMLEGLARGQGRGRHFAGRRGRTMRTGLGMRPTPEGVSGTRIGII